MPKAAQLRILVVDDQRTMRALVSSSLTEFGCGKCLEAEDGAEALRILAATPVDIVISDLNMPKLDGLQLLKKVRETASLANIAFIMLTSRGDGDLVRQAIALKVNNYLMKPFTLDGLRRKLEAVVGPLS